MHRSLLCAARVNHLQEQVTPTRRPGHSLLKQSVLQPVKRLADRNVRAADKRLHKQRPHRGRILKGLQLPLPPVVEWHPPPLKREYHSRQPSHAPCDQQPRRPLLPPPESLISPVP